MEHEGRVMVFRDSFEPDEFKGCMERLRPDDRELLHVIVKRGGDLTSSRYVIVFLYFQTERAARAAAAELTAAFTPSIHPPDEDVPAWTLKGETHASIVPPNVTAMSDFCAAIAERHGGMYDGWEAKFVQTPDSRRFARGMRWRRFLGRLTFWRHPEGT